MEKGQEFTSTDEHRGSRDRQAIYMSCMWVLKTLWKTTILLPKPKHGKTWYVSQKIGGFKISRSSFFPMIFIFQQWKKTTQKRARIPLGRRWPKSWTKLWTAPKWMFWFLNGWVALGETERLLRMGCFFLGNFWKTFNQMVFLELRTEGIFWWRWWLWGKDLDWRHPHLMRID